MPKTTSRLLFSALVVVAWGCGSDEPHPRHATPPHQEEPNAVHEMPTPQRTEVATGDMREVLLSLSRVHFALDSEELPPPARDALDQAAAKLREHPEVALFIEGHADQRGAPEYNLALGQRRGTTVANYLIRSGVGGDRLSVVSYGEERPLAEGEDQASLARNRRVEFRLMRGQVQLVLEEGALVNDRGTVIQ
jgi:peptidoglycan-associated lipoprotein